MRNIFRKRTKKMALEKGLDEGNIPSHVAIIMDGNGRWAEKRGLPRIAGHHAGMKTVKSITMAASDIGVKVLTLYAFSTENWKRPREEVEFLMKLPQEFLSIELKDLIKNNVRVQMMGWKDELPPHTLKAVNEAIESTKHNTGLILNFALNYGSRREMIEAMKSIAVDMQEKKMHIDDIDDDLFSSRLQSADLPELDLLIRTSGEIRISNFMLWQLCYSELWFTDCYWPAFSRDLFIEALTEYQRRIRKYGGLQ